MKIDPRDPSLMNHYLVASTRAAIARMSAFCYFARRAGGDWVQHEQVRRDRFENRAVYSVKLIERALGKVVDDEEA